jgi:hypothetical protein
MSVYKKFLWAAIIVLGAVSFGIVALTRGEPVNAAWLVIAAVCIYFIAFRLYGLFIANKVLGVNRPPIATTTASITCRLTATCFSGIISRP